MGKSNSKLISLSTSLSMQRNHHKNTRAKAVRSVGRGGGGRGEGSEECNVMRNRDSSCLSHDRGWPAICGSHGDHITGN